MQEIQSTDIAMAGMVKRLEKNPDDLYAQIQLGSLQSRRDNASFALSDLMERNSDASAAIGRDLSRGKAELSSLGVDLETGLPKSGTPLAEGRLWSLKTSKALGSDELPAVTDNYQRAAEAYREAEGYASKGKFEMARDSIDQAKAYMSAANQAKRDLAKGGTPGLYGQENNDGTFTKDWSGFAAWASVIAPIIALGIQSALTVSQNNAMRDFTKEENEKDRQQRMDEINAQGNFRLQEASIAAEASTASATKPTINQASSSVSLGGAFSAS